MKNTEIYQYSFLCMECDLQDVKHLLLLFIWDLQLDGEFIQEHTGINKYKT